MIEGPDGAGKSTLARALESHVVTHGGTAYVRHFGPPTDHPLKEYTWALHDRNHGDVMIFDRFHWGESVYAPLYRGGSQLKEAGHAHVELQLRAHGAIVVYLTADRDVLIERQRRLKEDFLREDDLDFAMQAYEWLRQTTILPVIKADHTNTIEAIVLEVMELARYWQEETSLTRTFTTYVGAPNPITLLLGDVRGTDTDGVPAAFDPAFVPMPNTSGAYLLDALLSSGIDMEGVGIANACDVDDVQSLWTCLGQPYVVALGRNAYDRCRDLHIPCAVVPHPQYIRRFFYPKHEAYGNAISRVAGTVIDASQAWAQIGA